jgi:hypothetical protein
MVPERDPEVLLARVDRLERRLARITRILAVAVTLVVLAAIAVLAGSRSPVLAQARGAAPGELVATSLKLVDATGRPRAVLYVDGKTAGLALSDPTGQTRVLLDTDGESSKLAIVGTRQGFPRINLTQQGDFQTLMLEDQKSGVALVHSASPSLLVSGGGSSAELKIDEVFASRQPTPTIVPKLVLKQGDKTVVELPAAPPR